VEFAWEECSLSVGLCSSVVVLHGNVRTEERESTGRVSCIVFSL
jgi:hypothetical protein